jgi:hypothetical protein
MRQDKRSVYGPIFDLVVDILPIQPAAVGCERIFSSSAQTITERRNRLADKTMEALQTLKYEYKQARSMVRMWLPREVDLEEMENWAALQLPEDVEAFVRDIHM